MSLVRACLLAVLASRCVCGAEAWLFVDDGRVGWGDASHEQVSLTLPDHSSVRIDKKHIQFQRSREEIERGVASMPQGRALNALRFPRTIIVSK